MEQGNAFGLAEFVFGGGAFVGGLKVEAELYYQTKVMDSRTFLYTLMYLEKYSILSDGQNQEYFAYQHVKVNSSEFRVESKK